MFSRIREKFENKNLKRSIRYLAYHDLMTGTFNRNWFDLNVNNKKTITKKYVYFIDINNLKQINKDGHHVGDKHIIDCVNSIKANKDKNDHLVRYGGDEFILFSNKSDVIKSNECFSVGVSTIDRRDVLRSIRIADKNMVKNKKNSKTF